jgi:uncharacterized membrane protein
MDTQVRSIVKAFSYRTAVAISIFLAAMIMSYSAGFGLKFVILSYTLGFVSFWVQERIWNYFKWGKDGVHDLKRRSVMKTITWRIWSFFVLTVFGLILGLSSESAIEWAVVTNILFIVVHYAHERIWNIISWGRKPIEE